MKVATRTVGDVAILDLDGKLTIGVGDVALRAALLAALDAGRSKLIVNLDQARSIDSSGLGELIRCKATAASRSAEVKLLHANLKARKLLTMASLVGVFEMFDDEQLAVESFSV